MNDEAHAHHSTEAKLVYMANQIATFFVSQPGDMAATSTADHIKSFWTPTMLRDIYRRLAVGGAGLSPVALDAVRILQARAAQKAR